MFGRPYDHPVSSPASTRQRSVVGPSRRPRRTQSERRCATRRTLLDATAASLIDHGFAGTTTTAICARAGVSQGTLFKHFTSKALLLGAAAEHLYDQLTERFVDQFEALEQPDNLANDEPDDQRIDRALELLWQVFQSDEFGASLELEIAARTDPTLRAVLGPVLTRHGERVRSQTALLFPGAVGQASFDRTIDLVLEVMVGMAVSQIADPSPEHYRLLLGHVTDLARHAWASTLAVPNADAVDPSWPIDPARTS